MHLSSDLLELSFSSSAKYLTVLFKTESCTLSAELEFEGLFYLWGRVGVSDVWCSSLLSAALINTMTKSNLGRKEFIWITHPDYSPSFSKVRAGTMKECAYWVSFLYNSGPPAQVWAGPSHVNQLSRKCPLDTCLQASLLEAAPQLRFLLPSRL